MTSQVLELERLRAARQTIADYRASYAEVTANLIRTQSRMEGIAPELQRAGARVMKAEQEAARHKGLMQRLWQLVSPAARARAKAAHTASLMAVYTLSTTRIKANNLLREAESLQAEQKALHEKANALKSSLAVYGTDEDLNEAEKSLVRTITVNTSDQLRQILQVRQLSSILEGEEIAMTQPLQPVVTSETAGLVRIIMAKLGPEGPMTLGNTATGEFCAVPPHIADLIRQVLASLAGGHQVTITENLTEMTPNEAAAFLNVSRMYVMKLIQEGVLPHRMVGNHHRIPYADLAAYKRQQQASQRAAMDELYALEREFGPVEGPPPLKAAFKSGGGRGR